MTPNRMTHCPFGGRLKKTFLLASILSLVVMISVLDWGSYNREENTQFFSARYKLHYLACQIM